MKNEEEKELKGGKKKREKKKDRMKERKKKEKKETKAREAREWAYTRENGMGGSSSRASCGAEAALLSREWGERVVMVSLGTYQGCHRKSICMATPVCCEESFLDDIVWCLFFSFFLFSLRPVGSRALLVLLHRVENEKKREENQLWNAIENIPRTTEH